MRKTVSPRAFGLLAALWALVALGCGSEESKEPASAYQAPATATATTTAAPVPSAADDRRLAKRAVLTLSDFLKAGLSRTTKKAAGALSAPASSLLAEP